MTSRWLMGARASTLAAGLEAASLIASSGELSAQRAPPTLVPGEIGTPGRHCSPRLRRLRRLRRLPCCGSPGLTEFAGTADRLVSGSDAVLAIDDIGIPKKGSHSVGVAGQYASMLGKRANCQTLVSLTLARNEVPFALGRARSHRP